MTEQISYKKFFKNYLIIVLSFAVVLGILIYLVKVSQKSWQKNLKTSIEKVLEENNPNVWTLGSPITIKNPFCMNAACYEARNRTNGEMYSVIILRISSFYGPIPAVFVCDNEMNIDFVGYSSLHGRILKQMGANNNSNLISYWKKRIPDIINKKNNQKNLNTK